MAVFVIDKQQQQLMPCSENRARRLLERDGAVVALLHPLAIRLKDRTGGETQPVRVKLDPGSRISGIALVRETQPLALFWAQKTGTHVGRVAARSTGSFNIQTAQGVVKGINHRHCRHLQRADGYGYFHQPSIAITQPEAASQAA